MKHMKVLSSSLILVFLAAMFVLPANAALQAVSPAIDPANGFPLWYQDTNALRLSLCLDQNGFCVLPVAPVSFGDPPVVVFDPANAVAFPDNFPPESFYWNAVASMDVGNPADRNTATMTMALVASFDRVPPSTDPVPVNGRQSTFLLVNLRIQGGAGTLAPNSNYTVTYPFGVFTFTTDAQGVPVETQGQVKRLEDPPKLLALQFAALLPATNTSIGPFLTSTGLPPGGILDPATGNRYIGDPRALNTITPGPFGSNFIIVGPNAGGAGVNIVQQSLWNIAGKSASGTVPPVIISTAAVPPTVEAVAGTSTLMATVTDDIGVAKVTVDLTQIGGAANTSMTLVSGTNIDGVWGAAVGPIRTLGTFSLPVTATDASFNVNTSTIVLTVVDTTPPVINSARASPDSIIPNGIDAATLIVDTKDFGDVSSVSSVTVNLSALGLAQIAGMTLVNGTALGGTWQLPVTTSILDLGGTTVSLPLSVTDAIGNSNISVSILLGIKKFIPLSAGTTATFNLTTPSGVINASIFVQPATTLTGQLIGAPVAALPALQGLKFAGAAVDLMNLTFDTPIRITLQYNTTVFSDPANETKLRLWFFNTTANRWEMTDNSIVDVAGKTVSGNVTHLSIFAALADITPPVISNINATSTVNSALINWTTDEISQSFVRFGNVSGVYTNTTNESSGTLFSVQLTGFTRNTTYFYIINSTDQMGNIAISAENTFTTHASRFTDQVAVYDRNGNDIIERDEAIIAVLDFFAGSIPRQQAVDVVVAFFS